MDLNTCSFSGNIGNDLELRHTKTGTAVLEFNLANTEGFGEKKKTNWFGVRVWGKTAEAMSQFLGKGRKVIIWGRLTQEEWDDKDTGKKRSKTIIIAENWTFADSDKGGSTQSRQEPQRRAETPPARREEPQRELPIGGADDGDDIPFTSFEKHSPLPL